MTHGERDGGPAEAAATRAQICDPRGKSGSRGRAGLRFNDSHSGWTVRRDSQVIISCWFWGVNMFSLMWEEVTGALFEWRKAGCLWSDGLLSVSGRPAWIKGLLVSVNHFGPGLNLSVEFLLQTTRYGRCACTSSPRGCAVQLHLRDMNFLHWEDPPGPSSVTHTHTQGSIYQACFACCSPRLFASAA